MENTIQLHDKKFKIMIPAEKIDEAEAQRLLDVNLGYEPAQPGDDKHHTAEPEEAAADTLARVEAEKKSKKK